MLHKQPIPDTTPSNDSEQACLVRPRDRTPRNVTGAAVKGKLMDSMGSKQSSHSHSQTLLAPGPKHMWVGASRKLSNDGTHPLGWRRRYIELAMKGRN